jgi:protein required for attachment to host cells
MDKAQTPSCWLAVMNAHGGRLFEGLRLSTGRLHLEERARLVETWEEKQHHRPYMLSVHGRGSASFAHEDEERTRRFGKEAARWLGAQMRQHTLPALTVFCANSLLGSLRKALGPDGLRHLDLRQEDLAWCTPAELVDHPAVEQALP